FDIFPLYSISLFSLTDTTLFVAFCKTVSGLLGCGAGVEVTSDFSTGRPPGVKKLSGGCPTPRVLSGSSKRAGRTITLGEAVELSRGSPVISSGSAAIDSLLQGGSRGGDVVEVYCHSTRVQTQ